ASFAPQQRALPSPITAHACSPLPPIHPVPAERLTTSTTPTGLIPDARWPRSHDAIVASSSTTSSCDVTNQIAAAPCVPRSSCAGHNPYGPSPGYATDWSSVFELPEHVTAPAFDRVHTRPPVDIARSATSDATAIGSFLGFLSAQHQTEASLSSAQTFQPP